MKDTISFNKKPWIFIPVEIKVREFDARLLLSCFAAQAGFGVIFGAKRSIYRNLQRLPRGIYLAKGYSFSEHDGIRHLRQLGFKIVDMDEEGLGVRGSEFEFRTARYTAPGFALADLILMWGSIDYDLAASFVPEAQPKMRKTGNPRTDLWRPVFRFAHAHRVQQHREKHGRYILLPSSTSVIHKSGKNLNRERAKKFALLKDKAAEEQFEQFQSDLENSFWEYYRLAEALAAHFPHENFIVRPHPSEASEHWEKLCAKYENLRMERSGSITPWILAAEMVIHSSCTSGLEAFLLDVPVISYISNPDFSYSRFIANSACLRTFSIEETIESVGLLREGKRSYPRAEILEALSSEISSLTGGLACEAIVDELKTLPVEPDEKSTSRKSLWPNLQSRFRDFWALRNAEFRNMENYWKQKFPGSTLAEVRQLASDYASALPQLDELRVEPITRNLYCIESATPDYNLK